MLENTKYRLLTAKKLNIAYFGGSITEGAGASDAKTTSYRAKTTAWLRAAYPEAEITEIQAAIGGTGTDLGVFRLDRDVLSFDPDLTIFEFAVNDSETPYERVLLDTESILRRLRRHNGAMDIVMIFTTTKTISENLCNGGEYRSRTAHSTLAHHYGNIMEIDVGEALRWAVAENGGDFLAFTKDTVHPNDRGYALYTELACRHLKEALTKAHLPSCPAVHPMPAPYSQNVAENAMLADAFSAKGKGGFVEKEEALCGRYPHYLEALLPDAELRFTFKGSRLGVYWMLAEDGGDILYSIDGGEEKTARAWDSYCLRFRRAHYSFLAEGLTSGEHTLTLRVAKTKAEESTGNAVRIGAFLVS